MLTTPFILLHLWSITSPKHSRFTNPMSRHEWLPHIGVPHISSWPLLTMFSQTMELLDSQPFPSKSLNIRKISDKPKCLVVLSLPHSTRTLCGYRIADIATSSPATENYSGDSVLKVRDFTSCL